jgi:hypothetical protein
MLTDLIQMSNLLLVVLQLVASVNHHLTQVVNGGRVHPIQVARDVFLQLLS